MIYTCSYKDFKTDLLKGVSISGDKGKDANWDRAYYLDLAPKKEFFRKWKDNKGKIDDITNNTYYIEEFYKQVLSNLDPLKVYRDLEYTILLCYEDNDEFCHRHIVSAWFELFLGLETKEMKIKGIYKEEVSRKQYDFIKNTLYKVIKDNINMKGFTSLRALYLFNKGEELEQRARELEVKNNKPYDSFYQEAAYLRSDADRYEEDNKLKLVK